MYLEERRHEKMKSKKKKRHIKGEINISDCSKSDYIDDDSTK